MSVVHYYHMVPHLRNDNSAFVPKDLDDSIFSHSINHHISTRDRCKSLGIR